MAQPIKAPKLTEHDPRLSCDYAQLVRLQAPAQQLSLSAKLAKTTAMSGRQSSPFRGRGLNFEELKHYQVGDDIRNIDWRVTLRSGKPHVRVYTEEKDRNVILIVDQRSSMYFASTDTLKSVVAAEVASILGWHFLANGDRVGLIGQTPKGIESFSPKRGQKSYLAALGQLARINQALSIHSQDSGESDFSALVKHLNQTKRRNATLVFVSDWAGCSEDDLDAIKRLQRHNEVLAIQVSDPLEHDLSHHNVEDWVVGDGEYQVQLDSRSDLDKANQQLSKLAQEQQQNLSRMMAVQKLPFVALNTDGDHINALIQAIGGRL